MLKRLKNQHFSKGVSPLAWISSDCFESFSPLSKVLNQPAVNAVQWRHYFSEPKNAFFVSRISSNTFCWLTLPKTKRCKNYFKFFLPYPWTKPFGKILIFVDFFNFLFFCSLKTLSYFLEHRQTVFAGWFCHKWKDRKISNFWWKNNVI